MTAVITQEPLAFNDMCMTLNKFVLLNFYKQRIYLESYIYKSLIFQIFVISSNNRIH